MTNSEKSFRKPPLAPSNLIGPMRRGKKTQVRDAERIPALGRTGH